MSKAFGCGRASRADTVQARKWKERQKEKGANKDEQRKVQNRLPQK